MKGSELARNQVTGDLDPFKMINKHTPEEKKSEIPSKQFFEEGDNVVRRSGFDEGMLRLNLQMNEQKVFIDQDSTDFEQSHIKKAKSVGGPGDITPEFDPNVVDTDNLEFGDDDEVPSNNGVAKPYEEEIEEEKNEADEQFEVIENDFSKVIKNKKLLKPDVKVMHDLYIDDKNEDEIFSKDVNVLDLVNTSYMEGKLRLTRYKLVFQPYKKRKHEIRSKVDFKKQSQDDEFTLMRLEKHRAQYFSIPVHMIYSVKEVSDKQYPE